MPPNSRLTGWQAGWLSPHLSGGRQPQQNLRAGELSCWVALGGHSCLQGKQSGASRWEGDCLSLLRGEGGLWASGPVSAWFLPGVCSPPPSFLGDQLQEQAGPGETGGGSPAGQARDSAES